MARTSYRSSHDYLSPWPEYVPVAERRRQASAQVEKLSKPGKRLSPVRIEGRTIASSTWGKAWCVALEAQADFQSRLGRGRSYVRSGCVIDLKIEKNVVEALISGSQVYRARLEFKPLPAARWRKLVQACAGQIGSLVELLRGKVSREVMAIMAQPRQGLFLEPGDLTMRCSCPDGAWMCKHLAAVLYGIGHRLDAEPEQLFSLRGVDASELLSVAPPTAPTLAPGRALLEGDLAALFGVDLDLEPSPLSQLPPSLPTPSWASHHALEPRSPHDDGTAETDLLDLSAPPPVVQPVSATPAAVVKKTAVKKAAAKKAAAKRAVTKKSAAKKAASKTPGRKTAKATRSASAKKGRGGGTSATRKATRGTGGKVAGKPKKRM